jgi:hypothetical protein
VQDRTTSPGPLGIWSGGSVCEFITAVPNIKLFAWGEGNSGGHVLTRDDEPRHVRTSSAHHALLNAGERGEEGSDSGSDRAGFARRCVTL